MADATHLAFSDESSHTSGRFRGVGMVSMPASEQHSLLGNVDGILKGSYVNEIKWSKIKGAKYRFAAIKIVDLVIEQACLGKLRVDVIVWDTEDRRHKIFGRDDKTNLQLMYLYLFRTSLRKRWPYNTIWKLFPDENSSIKWKMLQNRLDKFAKYRDPEYLQEVFGRLSHIVTTEAQKDIWNDLIGDFSVLEISEVNSVNAPISQIADLFAGVAVFSYQYYQTYCDWKTKTSSQVNFDTIPCVKEDFTPKENEHCYVLDYLNRKCKQHKFQVALKTTKGFFTHNPSKPINFWLYRPQSDYDKAPVRSVAINHNKVG